MQENTNNELKLEDIPVPSSGWGDIGKFALTFNGYEACGSFEKCADIANSQQHDSLTNLRICLFFEARRWRHFGYEPDGESMEYIREVVEKIRSKIVARSTP